MGCRQGTRPCLCGAEEGGHALSLCRGCALFQPRQWWPLASLTGSHVVCQPPNTVACNDGIGGLVLLATEQGSTWLRGAPPLSAGLTPPRNIPSDHMETLDTAWGADCRCPSPPKISLALSFPLCLSQAWPEIKT